MDRTVDRVTTSPERLWSVINHRCHHLHHISQQQLQQMRHSALLAHHMLMEPLIRGLEREGRAPANAWLQWPASARTEMGERWSENVSGMRRRRWSAGLHAAKVKCSDARDAWCADGRLACPSRRMHVLVLNANIEQWAIMAAGQCAMLIVTTPSAFCGWAAAVSCWQGRRTVHSSNCPLRFCQRADATPSTTGTAEAVLHRACSCELSTAGMWYCWRPPHDAAHKYSIWVSHTNPSRSKS